MVLALAAILIGLLSLVLTFFLNYLVLTQINATQLMWFVWLFNIPFVITATVLASALQQRAADANAAKKVSPRYEV